MYTVVVTKLLKRAVPLILIFGVLATFIIIFTERKPVQRVIVYAITPTYYRLTQKPNLVHFCNVLSLVKDVHWIVVEDANEKTS